MFTEGHVIVTLEFKKESNILQNINKNLEKILLLTEKSHNIQTTQYTHYKKKLIKLSVCIIILFFITLNDRIAFIFNTQQKHY